jgi:hypothetical protein
MFSQKRSSRLILLSVVFFGLMISLLNSSLFYKLWHYQVSIGGKNIGIERLLPIKYYDLQSFTHEFNFKKSMSSRGYSQNLDSINIELSKEDIKAFQKFYFDSTQINGLSVVETPGSINRGYLVDDINFWRKAKVTLPGMEKQKVKIKLHGTSPTPVLDAVSFSDKMKWRFFKNIDQDDFDISKGGFAFKLKINSADAYYQQKKRLDLYTPWDNWGVVSNSLNKYFKELGVITNSGDIKRVYINGQEIGPYLLVEKIDKEMLERDYKITNFAIFKNNDDWNKGKGPAHVSTTDYTSYDIEQSGVEGTIDIAQAKLKLLTIALEQEDIKFLEELVDVDNLAKVAALINITGRVQPVRGDNAKYIYDFASGKFQLAYRLEGDISNLQSKMPASFDRQIYAGGSMHKLIRLFQREGWFVDLRNRYLRKVVEDEGHIFSLINSENKQFSEIFSKTNFPTRKFEHGFGYEKATLSSNLKKVRNYLEYSKLYITLENNKDKASLSILHDSYTPSYIQSLTSCSNEKYIYKDPIYLKPSVYSLETGDISSIKSVIVLDSPFRCVAKVDAKKEYIDKDINSKDIYINYSAYVDFISEKNLDTLSKGMTTVLDENGNRHFVLQAGTYHVNEDIIFPYNASVTLKKGVVLLLNKNISFFVRGGFTAEGTSTEPVKVLSHYEDSSFGSFAILGSANNPAKVVLNNFIIGGGSEAVINGTYFSSQLSIHYSDTLIKDSQIMNSTSDDGINIKFSYIQILDSAFYNNFADQIDLDYSNGIVSGNKFYYSKPVMEGLSTDGLDISGSVMVIRNNIFEGMTDKGISVGESSNAIILENSFTENYSAIAVKDNSEVCIISNDYLRNIIDINPYVKKKMYDVPKLYLKEKSSLSINGSTLNDYKIYNELSPKCNDWLESISA